MLIIPHIVTYEYSDINTSILHHLQSTSHLISPYMSLKTVAHLGWLWTVAETRNSTFVNQILVLCFGNKVVTTWKMHVRCAILSSYEEILRLQERIQFGSRSRTTSFCTHCHCDKNVPVGITATSVYIWYCCVLLVVLMVLLY